MFDLISSITFDVSIKLLGVHKLSYSIMLSNLDFTLDKLSNELKNIKNKREMKKLLAFFKLGPHQGVGSQKSRHYLLKVVNSIASSKL